MIRENTYTFDELIERYEFLKEHYKTHELNHLHDVLLSELADLEDHKLLNGPNLEKVFSYFTELDKCKVELVRDYILRRIKYNFPIIKGIGSRSAVVQLKRRHEEISISKIFLKKLNEFLGPPKISYYELDEQSVLSYTKEEWEDWTKKNKCSQIEIKQSRILNFTATTYFTGFVPKKDYKPFEFQGDYSSTIESETPILFYTKIDSDPTATLETGSYYCSKMGKELYGKTYYSDYESALKGHKHIESVLRKIAKKSDCYSPRLKKYIKNQVCGFTSIESSALEFKYHNYYRHSFILHPLLDDYCGINLEGFKLSSNDLVKFEESISVLENGNIKIHLGYHPRLNQDIYFDHQGHIINSRNKTLFWTIKGLVETDAIYLKLRDKKEWFKYRANEAVSFEEIKNYLESQELTFIEEQYDWSPFERGKERLWLISEDHFYIFHNRESKLKILFCNNEFYMNNSLSTLFPNAEELPSTLKEFLS